MRTLILGDLHLGAGGSADLFDGRDALPALLTACSDGPLRVVLNGDVVDFVRVAAGALGLEPEPALPQIEAIITRWKPIFDALGDVLSRGGEIVWRVGSRDLPVMLAPVQQSIRRALGSQPRLRFEPIDQPTILRVGAAKILVTHGAHADPAERVLFDQLPDDGGAATRFDDGAGTLLARRGLVPLCEAGVRFAGLVGPRVGAGILAAAAIDPAAFSRVRVTQGLRIDWDVLLRRRPRSAVRDPLDLTDAVAALDLDGVELSEMRAALTRGRADAIDRWRIAALRVWARPGSGDPRGGVRLRATRPEWVEARRLKRLFDVDVVVLGHTHLPRWGADGGLLYANPGSWLPRLTTPSVREDDTIWAELIARLTRDPGLSGPAESLLTHDDAVVLIEPHSSGAAVTLEAWRSGERIRLEQGGTACHALVGTGTTSFSVRRAQERGRCRPLAAAADDGRPLLDPGALPAPGLLFPVERRPPDAPPGHGDLNDLADQLWGIVVAAGRWPLYRDALAPLIALREAEMDARAQIIEVRPEAVVDVPGAVAWASSHWITRERARRPGYLLLIGDLVELPLALQQVLATIASVGRIAFTQTDGAPDLRAYRAYADKVVRWSHRPLDAARVPLHAWVAEDGSRAIDASARSLVAPALGALTRNSSHPFETVKQLLIPWMQPAADQLLRHPALQQTQVLFTLAHGTAPPRHGWPLNARRARQGAPWLGGGVFLPSDALASRPMVAGGIWFAFGSFSAGTGPTSVYAEWLKQIDTPDARRLLEAFDGPPFINPTAQAALANSEGPLACIGHIDLAWSFGWQVTLPGGDDLQLHDRISLVLAALGGNQRGRPQNRPERVGHALRHLNVAAERYADALAQRRRLMGAASSDRVDGALWLARQDLESYILLGDPAVHLPLTPEPTPRPRMVTDAPTVPNVLPTPDARAVRDLVRGAEDALVEAFRAAGRAALPSEELEADVLAHLAGEPLGDAVAQHAARYVAAGRAAIGLKDT